MSHRQGPGTKKMFLVSHPTSLECVVAQGQLARHVTWLDPIDDGEMVRQSVANWTEAKVRANMRDQYRMKGTFHGKGANRGQDRDRDRDRERGRNQGS